MTFTLRDLKIAIAVEIFCLSAVLIFAGVEKYLVSDPIQESTQRAPLAIALTYAVALMLAFKSFVYIQGPKGDREYALKSAATIHCIGVLCLLEFLVWSIMQSQIAFMKCSTWWPQCVLCVTIVLALIAESMLVVIMQQILEQFMDFVESSDKTAPKTSTPAP